MAETILLVEDEESLLEVLRLVLIGTGYDVIVARDGTEAVNLYRTNKDRVSLVLSDMGLPTLGGWEMFQQIRTINPNAKVILASGYYTAALREEFVQAGACDFIQKPYIPEVILQKIREVIDRP